MSEAPQSKNNTTLILAVVIIVAAAIGGYVYYKETQSETVSMQIGGKEISATFEK